MIINLLKTKLTKRGEQTVTIDRGHSFSVQPDDQKSNENIKLLKEHCSKTGISFSRLVLKGIDAVVKELNLDTSRH
jgi:hypothetical protein